VVGVVASISRTSGDLRVSRPPAAIAAPGRSRAAGPEVGQDAVAPDRHELEAARFTLSVSRERAGLSRAGGDASPVPDRRYFEDRLGIDLSAVRLHRGDHAAALAETAAAHAYTVGSDVVIGRGQGPGDLELVAHELAHVAQQSGGAPRAGLSATDRRIQRWDSYEHIELGDDAPGGPGSLIVLHAHERDFPERADRARWPAQWKSRLEAPSVTRDQIRAATQGLTYGEVVALAGDFYGKFTNAAEAERSTFDALDMAPLSEIVELIPLIHGKQTTTTQLQEATGGRYLDLAASNVSHFSNVPAGRRNIDVWRSMHRSAVMLAQHASADPMAANHAWGLNAAADHFLTDAFSAGHLRTPRAELIKQGTVGNIESKILHDLDNKYGVEVTNARGDKPWIAYGDDALAQNPEHRQKVIEAVALSKRDISDAIAQGTAYALPAADAPFPAEALVPFPTNPSADRWTGRTPTYAAGPDGDPVQVADDYTRMRDEVFVREAPGIVRGFFTDDDEVRAWVQRTDLAAISRQRVSDKIRMIDTVLGGFFSWISDDDVATIERICQSVTDPGEMAALRAQFYDQLPDRMTSIGQRTRVRLALTRI
jgi:hypothetical protein